MTNETFTDKQKELIKSLAVDLKPLVDDIEKSPMTTRNHYGRYGSVLTTLSSGDKTKANFIAYCLIEAGANKGGVLDAFRAFFG